MKTAKEKAKELIDKFTLLTTGGYDLAKESALICVDEILSINDEDNYQLLSFKENFYKEVKSEIEKL